MRLITSQQSECLRVKGAEQLRIPSAWLVFIVLDVEKMVCSIVEHSSDDERTFPIRGEFVWLLLIQSKNQVSFLKCSTPHVESC